LPKGSRRDSDEDEHDTIYPVFEDIYSEFDRTLQLVEVPVGNANIFELGINLASKGVELGTSLPNRNVNISMLIQQRTRQRSGSITVIL